MSSGRPHDHSPPHFKSPPTMGKCKVRNKNKNITKIDPDTLKLRPFAVSQHTACDGTRVTAVIKSMAGSICKPSTSQVDPSVTFSTDMLQFLGEYLEDDGNDDGGGGNISRGYYVAQVCISSSFAFYMW